MYFVKNFKMAGQNKAESDQYGIPAGPKFLNPNFQNSNFGIYQILL